MNAREKFEALAQELEDDSYSSIAKDIRAILAAHDLVPITGTVIEGQSDVQTSLDWHVDELNNCIKYNGELRAENADARAEIKALETRSEEQRLRAKRAEAENESLRAELAALKEWAPGAIHQWQERAGKLRRKQDRRPSLEWLQKWRERAETSSEKLLELIKKYAWRKESFFWREDRCPRRTYLRGYVTHRHDRLLRRIDRRIKEARG